jgi:hypothetical protein
VRADDDAGAGAACTEAAARRLSMTAHTTVKTRRALMLGDDSKADLSFQIR